ncbi:sialic acid-binding Ig-like lectin 14 isoform X2 [Sphaeramia orbicularis]|nr:sialic acid-binding Ig-like lectin 14 isoform X2 [Sphaeramia orbicularis]
MTTPVCLYGFCISLSEEEITAEAGLCTVIHCSFSTVFESITDAVWYKCDQSKRRCGESDIIFHSSNQNKIQPGFRGRVSLLEPNLYKGNCSIDISDLDQSDSGSYQFRVNGLINQRYDGFTFSPRASVSVKALTQKPTVEVPALTEGQQTTLTCTAPGLCSGSDPIITWTWRRSAEDDSYITGNITTTHGRNSSLTFTPSAKHHSTEVTCKVNFRGNTSTQETVTLNLTCFAQENGGFSAIPLTVTVVSLIVNILLIVCLIFLWSSRKKMKQNQEDKTYVCLRKRDISPDYDVVAQQVSASVD